MSAQPEKIIAPTDVFQGEAPDIKRTLRRVYRGVEIRCLSADRTAFESKRASAKPAHKSATKNTAKFTGDMTKHEWRCVQAIQRWRHRARLRALRQAWRFPLAYADEWNTWSHIERVLYFIVALIGAPVLMCLWLLRGLAALISFFFKFIEAKLDYHSLRSPGERNLQGVHHAFAKIIDLPTDYYLKCIDDWIRILYLSEHGTVYQHNLPRTKDYVDPLLLNEFFLRNARDHETKAYINHQLFWVREHLSKKLGHYR